MSVTEEVSFDKEGNIEHFPLFRKYFDKLFLSIIIILVAVLSFGIGRLSVAGNREAIKIEYDPSLSLENSLKTVNSKIKNSTQSVVTSKNGSKYHYSHCAGAKQIKEENKLVFASASAAEAAGYALASNCKSP